MSRYSRWPAVVLVHGGLVDSRLWDDQMQPLSQRFRVVRYDLRGFGKSAAPAGQYWPTEDLRALFSKIDPKLMVHTTSPISAGSSTARVRSAITQPPRPAASMVPVRPAYSPGGEMSGHQLASSP